MIEGWHVRPIREPDYARKSDLLTRTQPDRPVSPEEVRQWDRLLEEPRIFRRHLVAEDPADDSVVGFASLFNSPWNYDPAKYTVDLTVDPDHRGNGLGRRLYETLEGVARDRGAILLWTSVRAEDARSCRFFARSGFVERRRSWASRLDLLTDRSGDPEGPTTPAGIVLTSLADEGPERPEVRERFYRLRRDAGQDVPSMGTPTPYTFEQFLAVTVHHPGFVPEACFVARSGDRYVATTSLETVAREPDTLHVAFTGTVREFRGHGLATELKRRAIRYARAHGYRYLTTDNDSLNTPILRINEALGFRVQRTTIRGEKRLAG